MYLTSFSKFSQVSGIYNKFLKGELVETPTLFLQQVKHNKFESFVSANLTNIFYKEANLYLDKALYQYILSRKLITSENFSWGAVTQYYASFFVISGLIRLHEVAFVRIGANDYEIQSDTGMVYKIRLMKTKGLHRTVWETYYKLYKNFTHANKVFSCVMTPYMSDIYFDTNRRNDINYAPSKGYDEIYQTKTTTNRLKKERTSDSYSPTNFYKENEWVDVSVLTQHRIRLLANLICKIDGQSDFPVQAKERVDNREKIIQRYEDDIRYRKRYLSWIRGE